MKKPAIEWFESVKDDELREKLINNADINGWSSYPKSSLARAISSGFAWHKAPEGIEYWRSIRDKAILGEIELKDTDSEATLEKMKKLTIKQWFESVKDDELRGRLLNNMVDSNRNQLVSDLFTAIFLGFCWHETTEGVMYWDSICERGFYGKIELKDVDSEDTLPGSKEEIINPKVSRGDILEKLNRVEELLIEIKKEI